MLRHALVSMLAMSLVVGPAALPAASLADDIKPKAPETAFSGKLRPDILGISTESNAEFARAVFDSLFKGRTDSKTDIQQQKFGERQLCRCAELQPSRQRETERRDALDQLLLARERQPRLFHRAESDLRAGPAAVQGRHDQGSHGQIRRAHHRRRSASLLHLPQARSCPSAASTRKRPRWKRSTSRSTPGPPSSSTAIPSAAVAWRSSSARRPRPRSRAPCSTEAKGANCDGVLSVQLVPGTAADRVGIA